jgi:hypothetical protein
MKRRRVVSLTGSALALALAGCLGGDDDQSGDENATDGNDTTSDDGDDATDENGDDSGAPFGGAVEATSQGGYLALAADSRADATANGFPLPAAAEGDDPIVVTASVDGDGSWESTAVDFRPIPIEEPVEGQINVDVPDGLSGDLDPEAGLMTVAGELVATVTSGDGDELGELSVQIDATTGESGALTGSASFDTEPARVTLVDNEFAVEGSDNPLINSFVGLPSESGQNWFELELALAPA